MFQEPSELSLTLLVLSSTGSKLPRKLMGKFKWFCSEQRQIYWDDLWINKRPNKLHHVHVSGPLLVVSLLVNIFVRRCQLEAIQLLTVVQF